MRDPLLLASIVTFLRFIYLKSGVHDCLYGTFYNGYTVIILLSILLGFPIPLICALLVGRVLYRKVISIETYSDIYDPTTMLFFFIGMYICCLLK